MPLTDTQNDGGAYPSLDVVVDGATYGLFGVRHEPMTMSRYRRELASEFQKRNNWLLEQDLSTVIPIPGGIEIADYAASDKWELFKDCAKAGLQVPLFIGLLLYRGINPKKTVKNDKLELYASIKWAEYAIADNRTIVSKPYANCTRRSGYMAAFMKAWKQGENKNMLVGADHVPEMAQFLRAPIEDKNIVDLATAHAALLENDPVRFNRLKRMILYKETAAILSGTFLGGSPYFLALSAFS